jgi:AraC-like DNA-binding protein
MIKLLGLISPVIVPLIVAGLLMFSSEKNNRPKLYLVFYMLLISFIFAANFYYFQHQYNVYTWVHSLHIGAVLAIYPGAYVYIMLLIDPWVKARKLIVHFIPSMLFFSVSAAIFFIFLSMEERTLFLAEYRLNPDFTKTWLKILYYIRMGNILVLFIQVFVYLILITIVLQKHRKTMAELFSNPEKFQLNWLRFFNVALALSAFIAVFLYAANPVKLFGDDRFLAYPLLLIALILWFLGIMGNNQAMLPESTYSIPASPESTNNQQQALAEKLLIFFSEKKPYHDPDLRIWDVSRELGSNRTYISQLINSRFKQNFAGFVNSYRIKEAMQMMEENPEKDTITIAGDVGFGSAASLSRAFSAHYNMKISEFRKKLQRSIASNELTQKKRGEG